MYEILITEPAKKFLKKLDKNIKKRILDKIEELADDPKKGIPLVGNLSGLWKLRIGDYRAIYKIFHDKLIVSVIKIGHRKNIYD